MINEHDVVVLTHDLEDYGLEKGHRGAVVHCYPGGEGFEVEFIEPPHVITLKRDDIKLDTMIVQNQVAEIIDSLPEDAVAEVRDFAKSLKQKYLARAS